MTKSRKKYTFKEGAAKLEELVLKYKKANIYSMMLENKVYVISDKADEDKMKEYNSFKIIFEAFLATLEEDEKQIIKNDFYDHVQENWWIGIYSRSTYYRIKNRAIKKLLYFYE
jgi:DNA-directed RNA polymerase specialized sigma subunit